MIYDKTILPEILKVDYKALHNHDWDNFICISGGEGSGKTKLSLWITHIWIKLKFKREPIEEDCKKYIGVSLKEYATVLNNLEGKGNINVCDEAGDVFTGKNSGSKIVKKMEETYSVIRGDNLFTIWNVPTFFVLSPYFRNWRIRSLIYVERRGFAHFYHKPKRLKLSELNSEKNVKDYFLEPPLFSFTFPDYTGVLLKPYLEMKNKKMQNCR